MRSFTAAALGTGLLLAATTALAGPSEEEIARLGGPEPRPSARSGPATRSERFPSGPEV